jgi:hypothetical protein
LTDATAIRRCWGDGLIGGSGYLDYRWFNRMFSPGLIGGRVRLIEQGAGLLFLASHSGRVGLNYRTLRMDARSRVDCLMADRAARPGRSWLDGGVVIVHRIHHEHLVYECLAAPAAASNNLPRRAI